MLKRLQHNQQTGGWTWLPYLMALLFVLQLAGCASSLNKPAVQVDDKLESKPVVASTSGFGGTGRSLDEAQQIALNPADQRHSPQLDNGFGGTGHSSSGFGGTGIVGPIENFGSIWVNGIEVGVGQKTKIYSNLPGKIDNLTVADLRVGQQVWLETDASQEKTTTAQINVYYPLAGRIDQIQVQGMATELLVNGQRVYISSQTVMPAALKLNVGEYIRVSGLPVYAEHSKQRTNAWYATLVEPHAERETWYKSVPYIKFSDSVNRVVMHDNWQKAYQAGEFKQIPAGLSSQPKIKIMGKSDSKPAAEPDVR